MSKSVPAEKEQQTEEITPVVVEKEPEPVREEQEIKEEIQQAEQQTVTAKEQAEAITAQPEQAVKITPETASSSGRYLAVKTNLAAWAGTIMNVAADVQVSEHFSVELPVSRGVVVRQRQTCREDVYHPARSPLLVIEAGCGSFLRRTCTRRLVQREMEPRPLSGHRPSATRSRHQLRLPAAL